MSKVNLIDYASNTYSQCGQDGVLAKLFELMGIERGYCVEFGAWDGIRFSNTRALLKKNWSGVLIETHAARFQELESLYSDREDVVTVNRAIDLYQNSLDDILLQSGAPENLDFMSIDIDGDDYHIWNGLKQFKPKVVLIETNPYLPIFMEYIQPYQSKHLPMGSSILSTLLLGKSKGYTPVAYISHDWLFVRNDQLPHVELPSAFEMVVRGGKIRGNELLSCGDRKELPGGVAGTDFIDVKERFDSICPNFDFEDGTHVQLRINLTELEELL